MLVKEFESELNIQNKNKKTISGYINDIHHFLEFIKIKQLYINDIKEITIKEFMTKLRNEGVSSSTISRKVSALRKYFKFLRKNRVMNTNPIEDINNPIIVKKEQKITQTDFEEMMQRVTLLEEKGEKYIREKIFLHLMFLYKIPLSEVVKIKKENYKINQQIIYISKAVKLKEETVQLLDEYIKMLKHPQEYLFVNQRGESLTESGAYYLLKKIFKAINKGQIVPRDFFKK